MEMEYKHTEPVEAAKESEALGIARKLWTKRRFIGICCGIAAAVGLVIGFSIPKEYSATAILAPEAGNGMSSSVSQLAGLMGYNVGYSSRDAVSPMLYPEVVASTPFLADLFELEVTDRSGKIRTTLYDYLENHTRFPWWSSLFALPGRAIGWVGSLFSSNSDSPAADGAETAGDELYRFTKAQTRVMQALANRIEVTVDKKTMVVTITVQMQDPEISATVAQAVIDNLKQYITTYRTSKACNDLEFSEKFFAESKANYEAAQERYANYTDRNQNIVLHSVKVEQDRLENEMRLTYNVYNQAAQQLIVAKAKVQESMPVYAVIRPVTVPNGPSSPNKLLIVAGCVFLAGVCASAWVLFGDALRRIRRPKHESGETAEA